MKKIISLLTIVTSLILTSCSYNSNDDFSFTDDISIIKNDSVNYNIVIHSKSYKVKNLNLKLVNYAVTESSDMNYDVEIDTCLTLMCTYIGENTGFYPVYYYTFSTLDGNTFIRLTNDRVKKFNFGDTINLFTNKKTLRTSESI